MPVFDAIHAAPRREAKTLLREGFGSPPLPPVWFFKNNPQGRAAAESMAEAHAEPVCIQAKINYRTPEHAHWTAAMERKVRDRLAALEEALGRPLSAGEELALRGKILRLALMLSGKSGVNMFIAAFPLLDEKSAEGAKKVEGCVVLRQGPLPLPERMRETP